MEMEQTPRFLFGAQYYRAPTPAPECWAGDLANMRALGMDTVKFWVQWRWSHRTEQAFYFDDLDRLMDLAAQNGLRVTLNIICDGAPSWVFRKWPEAKMVTADGRTVEPQTPCHRQLGGFPGVCYNHAAAQAARMRFVRAAAERYRDHPALEMWDVWNEPEQCGPYREPHLETMTCYCDSCRARFLETLRQKYGTVEQLNAVWGRCYTDWDEVELPRQRQTFGDFLDFRRFQLDTMTEEARQRLAAVRAADPRHPAYLHVVPNTSGIFNAVTGVDDFALAGECDVFASTNFAQPVWSVLTASAGRGKPCYNVECHIGSGSTQMHQRQITPEDMRRDLLPQIGMGIRGFLFWQYRPELLGYEAPAWGMTKPDGTPGSVGLAAQQFIETLRPLLPRIQAAPAPRPAIAIWKGIKNELFHFCVNEDLTDFAAGIENYVNTLYYSDYNCRIVDDEALIRDLDGVKLLLLPDCYAADARVCAAVDAFVRGGGTVLCEAHFGLYNADTNRHGYAAPGCGLAAAWGIREAWTSASYHLRTALLSGQSGNGQENLGDDERKAVAAYGLSGGKYFNFTTKWGFSLTGSRRFACVEADGGEVVGSAAGVPCLVTKQVGRGQVWYCGTNLGEAALQQPEGFAALLLRLADGAGVRPNLPGAPAGTHTDLLDDGLCTVCNATEEDAVLPLGDGWRGVFTGIRAQDGAVRLPAGSAELFVRETAE